MVLSKDITHSLMGTYNIGSTQNVQFINESFNNTVATQGPGHEDRVVSGKEYS